MKRGLLAALLLVLTAAGPAFSAPPRPDSLAVPARPPIPVEPAASPGTVLYQGRLTDGSGVPRIGPVSLVISLYTAAEGGSSIWSEEHPSVPLTVEGIFTLLLGNLTPFPANAWSEPDRWLGLSVDGSAELQPRLKVASVPFAIEANRLGGKRATDFDPVGAADLAVIGAQSQLKGSDQSPPNQGSNQVHWNNLYGVPDGFADGVDNLGQGTMQHGELLGLDADDHPQYALESQLATTDNTPPNSGENRVHWDVLGGVPLPLVNHLIPSDWIEAGAVDSTRLGNGQVLSRHLAPGGIQGDRLAPGAVASEQIADGSITSEDVQNSSLTGDDILNGTIGGVDIQNESISSSDVLNQSLLGVNLAAGAVGTPQLEDGGVTGAKIAQGAVGTDRLANGAVSADKLQDGSVTAGKLAPGSVNGAAVADGTLADADLAEPPGIAWLNMPGYADSIVSLSGETIAALTLNVPGPGYVALSAEAQVYMLHTTGTESRATLALSEVPDQIPDSLAVIVSVAPSLPSEFYTLAGRVSAVIPVTIGGVHTFYLNARRVDPFRMPSLHNVRVQGVWYRRRY